MKQTTRKINVAVLVACLAGLGTSQAAIFSDFESPTYTAGTSFIGVDGWDYASGIPFAHVTPDSGAGFPDVISGSQSAIVSGTAIGRGWNGLESLVNTNSTFISVLVRQTHPTFRATAILYFSDDVATLSTPAGVELKGDGSFSVFDVGGETSTGVADDPNDLYRLGLLLDFAADTFTAFADNVTEGTPRMNLGTYDMVGAPKLVSDVRNNGGIILSNPTSVGGQVPVWDDVEVVPEPGSVALMLVSFGLLWWQRRGGRS